MAQISERAHVECPKSRTGSSNIVYHMVKIQLLQFPYDRLEFETQAVRKGPVGGPRSRVLGPVDRVVDVHLDEPVAEMIDPVENRPGVAPALRREPVALLDWIDCLGDRLIEMHIHDAINWAENPRRGTAHRSFTYGLCLELEPIVKRLKERDLIVPLISEMYEPTAEGAVATLAETKERIVRCWEG